jgi:hypothetical protein
LKAKRDRQTATFQEAGLVARFFFARACFHFTSSLSTLVFGTAITARKRLPNRWNSVLPGTFGAGNGFIWSGSLSGFEFMSALQAGEYDFATTDYSS